MGNDSKKPSKPRVALALADIQKEFVIQLRFLKKSCDAYDAGDLDEFRRIALAVRVLVYDSGHSKSVASQLDLKTCPFYAFSRPVNPKNLMTEMPLVIIRLGPAGSTYLPRFTEGLSEARILSFEDWWNEAAFRSRGGLSMSRSGFILHTANQAGGAHVDPNLDKEFHSISKENEAGLTAFLGTPDNQLERSPIIDLEKAYVRHIGFEVMQALEPQSVSMHGNKL